MVFTERVDNEYKNKSLDMMFMAALLIIAKFESNQYVLQWVNEHKNYGTSIQGNMTQC